MPADQLDRDLLFGVLALQNDLVSRDALFASLIVAPTDASRPLADRLASAGVLLPDERKLVEALVEKHLQRHGGDAARSLAALTHLGALRDELQMLASPALDATLEHLPAPSASPTAPSPQRRARPDDHLRFRILRPHAKGGLGEVYVAQDLELQREVALKEIQEKYADQPDSRSRFVLEAEVTGALEHPGIVPVYGLGQYADGRPFYAMRFIRGASLKEEVDEYYQAEKERADARPSAIAMGQAAVEFRKLLRRFMDVCNAIEYAHSRGVLHRDLKPGNIMLGPYGETLVVDWGLAKLTDRDEPAEMNREASIRPASASGSAATEMGSAVGTPAFMSPEQAAGRLEELSPASDVYSLGATLYYVLTGKPPFPPGDMSSTLGKVQAGDFPAPRTVRAAISPPLEAICLKAMALAPAERYQSPAALAEDLEKWLADEPVSCWPEPLSVRARRWMKRHRALVTSTVATLVVALLATLGGLLQQSEHNRVVSAANARLSEANSELLKANARESRAKQQALANEAQAKANALLAEQNADKARQEEAKAKQSAEEAHAVLDFVRRNILAAPRPQNQKAGLGINTTIRQALEQAEPRVAGAFENQPVVEASVREALGGTYASLGEFKKAIEQYESCWKLREQHHGADHLDTLTARGNVAIVYKEDGQIERAISILEEVHARLRSLFGPTHQETLAAQHSLALTYHFAGRVNEALATAEEEVRLKRETLAPDAPRLLSGLSVLSGIYASAGQTRRAIEILEELWELQKRKLGPNDLATLETMNNLGAAYRAIGQSQRAVPLFEHVLEKRTAVYGADHPTLLVSMNNLAAAYRDVNDLQRATPLFEKTLDNSKKILGPDHPNTFRSMNNLGTAYRSANRLEEALPLFEQAAAGMRQKLGVGHQITQLFIVNLADAYEQLDQQDKAAPLWQELTDQWQKQALVERPEPLADEVTTIMNGVLKGNAQRAHVELLLREFVKLQERLRPDHWATADAQATLGGCLTMQKKYAEAEPLLLAGYRGMAEHEDQIPAREKTHLTQAAQWLVQLYEGWEKPEEAAEWQKVLEERQAKETPEPGEAEGDADICF